MRARVGNAACAIAALALAAACGGEDTIGTRAEIIPDDWETAWAELRDCRNSHEHNLHHIRVFANAAAEEPYRELSPDTPYPVGAILLKPEYDYPGCNPEDIVRFTVMEKQPSGYSARGNDWRWIQTSADLTIEEDGERPGCISCHEDHCAPPVGYDMTCDEEPRP
jgi:hypothetical protein